MSQVDKTMRISISLPTSQNLQSTDFQVSDMKCQPLEKNYKIPLPKSYQNHSLCSDDSKNKYINSHGSEESVVHTEICIYIYIYLYISLWSYT
jgi:hypothetical protein